MALSCERGSARIKVQVVATLLPLNVPVHVDSFWTLVKFSETQTICDVENRIISCLNSLAKECPIELAVHEGPISPSWTYVQAKQSSGETSTRAGTVKHKTNSVENRYISSDNDAMQQLTILLKPQFCQYIPGTTKTIKPASPVLTTYDISHYLRSVRLIFRRQLVFMHGSVLLGDSKSEILRDKDVVIINTICGFLMVNHDNIPNALSCETESSLGTSSEAEIDLDCHHSAALKDVDESSLFWETDEENSNGLERELSNEIKEKIDKLLKKLARLKHLHKHDGKGCITKHKKAKQRKISQGGCGTEVSNASHAETNNSGCHEQKQKKKSNDEQLMQDVNEASISDANRIGSLCNRRRKKSIKRKYESEVDTVDLMDTSFSHAADVIQKSYEVIHSDGRKEDELVDCTVADMAVESLQKKNTDRKHKAIKPAGMGLSNLLLTLRNQQADGIKCNEYKQKTDVINEENGIQRKENAALLLEKTAVSPSIPDEHLISAQATPKRRRVRKRKNKKLHADKSASIEQNSKCIDKDYSLRLPEHLMPQNSRVTFECDSEEDDAILVNQTAGDIQAIPKIEQQEATHMENSVMGNDKKTSQLDVNNTSVATIIAKSEVPKVSFNNAGAPIDPDGKFQVLLHQYGRLGRHFETISSDSGHTVIKSSRQKRHKFKSNLSDAADPERDVLTNVSIITQHIPTTKTSASDTNSVHCITSAAGDGCENLEIAHNRLSSNLKSTRPESKPVLPYVEVTPLYMNYISCKELCGWPMESDIIAYKILELSEDYTPGLSKFKEAKVIKVDVQTGSLLLEPRGGKDDKKRSGRFELNFKDVTDNPTVEEDNCLITVNLADLVDTRLVARSTIME